MIEPHFKILEDKRGHKFLMNKCTTYLFHSVLSTRRVILLFFGLLIYLFS